MLSDWRADTPEAFVVAQIQVGLRSVVGDVDFAVLIGAHRPRIDIEIRVEFADPHPEPARLQQRSQTGRHEPLAKRGDHAAGDENVPRHGN